MTLPSKDKCQDPSKDASAGENLIGQRSWPPTQVSFHVFLFNKPWNFLKRLNFLSVDFFNVFDFHQLLKSSHFPCKVSLQNEVNNITLKFRVSFLFSLHSQAEYQPSQVFNYFQSLYNYGTLHAACVTLSSLRDSLTQASSHVCKSWSSRTLFHWSRSVETQNPANNFRYHCNT